MNYDLHIFVVWVGGTPGGFFICALALVPCLRCLLCRYSPSVRLAFFCLRDVPCVFAVLNLTALCQPFAVVRGPVLDMPSVPALLGSLRIALPV